MSEWREYLVSEIASPEKNALVGGPFGSNLVSKDYTDEGVPVIRGQNMSGGRWVGGDFAFVSEDKALSLSANLARPGDLIFTQRGTLGQVAIVPDQPYEKYIVSQSQMKLSADDSKADVRFLYYLFSSPEQQHYIKTNAIQVGVPHTNLGILKNTPISLPSLKIQKEVARQLNAIDDKIELNRQINQMLEEMAQAIFKSWFVDFDPVKAKMIIREKGGSEKAQAFAAQAFIAGNVTLKELESMEAGYSGWEEMLHPLVVKNFEPMGLDQWEPEQLAATAALFPSTLTDSPLGPIPEGWDVEDVGRHIDAVRGLSYKGAGLADAGMPLHNLNSVYESGGYKHEGLKFYSLDYKEKHLAKPGDVIVANTEQGFEHLLIGYGAMIPSRYPKGIYSHHLYRVRPKKNSPLTPQFILHLFLPGRFRKLVAGYTNGTTVNMLPADGLDKPQFVVPNGKLIKAFSSMVHPMREHIEANIQQNESLAKTRDALLPKLLSGEISVGAAEAELEEAA